MDCVVVTGFGPFGDYKVNSSWEVAKELENYDFANNSISLITEEIPVVYETVMQRVPALWELHNPKLMVHIGVSSYATKITLETCAHKDGYEKVDTVGELPERGAACGDGASCIRTCFDIEKASLQFNATNTDDVKSCVSVDAGHYLCEFIFYTSLCVNPERTVFIHVPDIGKPYTVAQMGKAVKEIILLILDQIRENCPS